MKTLKKWLAANAIFSTISGLTMILTNYFLQSLMGISIEWLFQVVGVNLLAFGGILLYAVYHTHIRWLILLIILLDVSWVVGSILIFLIRPERMTDQGYILIGIVGGIVSFLAWKQSEHR